MNRRDLDAMRQRLAARAAAEEDDPPILLGLVSVLLVVVFIFSMFVCPLPGRVPGLLLGE